MSGFITFLTGVPLGVYFLISLLNLALLTVAAVRLGRRNAGGQSKAARFMTAAAGRQPVQRLRAWLETIADAAGWPVRLEVARRVRRRADTPRGLAVMRLLWPLDAGYAVVAAAGLMVVTGLDAAGLVWPPLAVALAVLALAGATGRHLSYLLGGLAERLRRSLLSPLPTLAAIAAGDAVTLACAASLILAAGGGAHIGVAALRTGVLDLLAFKKLTWSTVPHDSIRELIVALAGLLFYTSVAKTLVTPGQYARKGGDYSTVSFALAAAGDARQARQWSLRDKDGGPASLQAKAMVELADGHFTEALRVTSLRQRAKGEDDSVDSGVLYLSLLAAQTTFLGGEDAVLAFILAARAAGASDAAVTTCLSNAVNLRQLRPGAQLLPLLAMLPEDSFPLGRGLVLANAGNHAGARALLDGMVPVAAIDVVLRAAALLELNLADAAGPEMAERIRQWRAKLLPAVTDAVDVMPQHWKRSAASALMALSAAVLSTESEGADELVDELVAVSHQWFRDVNTSAEIEQLLTAQWSIAG